VQYVFVPLIAVVALGLAWTWWSSRIDRDPAATVHSFHKALDAMQPGGRPMVASRGGPDRPGSGEVH